MKRVLIFSTTYSPFVGGAELAVEAITNRIDKNDIQFDVITLRFDSELEKKEEVGNVNVYRVGFTKSGADMSDLVKFPLKINKLIFPFVACFKACSLHKKNKYDAIWAIMASYSGFAALFFKFIHPKVPYLLTLQEGDPIEYIKKKVRFVYPLFKRIFTKADFIQVISSYLGKWAKDMGYKGKLEIVPNAVDTSMFSIEYYEGELAELKEEFGKKSDDKWLITTSRLVKKNAVDDVIRALSQLSENIKFIILGIGPDMEMLKDLAKERGVENRVKFLGLVNSKEIPKYLKISDIFIRPSLSEGFGNSFVEAMAAGVPVIATQEGGIADFLFDVKRNPDRAATGWAVDTKSPESIANAIKDILNNPEQTKKVVENAEKLAFEKYDWNLISRDMKSKVFDKLLIDANEEDTH